MSSLTSALQLQSNAPQVLGIGEILWDLLPSGPKLGGAPANFTYHAQAMGAKALPISQVGDDALGMKILSKLDAMQVSTAGIAIDAQHATGTVTVELADDGQPRFTIHDGVAWDHLAIDDSLEKLVLTADAVCFGTLAQRREPSRGTIQALVRATPATALRVFDVNLRQNFYSRELLHDSLELSNVLKLNDAELPIVSDLLGISGDARQQIAGLCERYDLRLLACTRGGEGSLIYRQGEWCEHPGLPANVRDTIGAGDSFTASITMGMLLGWTLEEISDAANRVAAYVCSCDGATPELPLELRDRFRRPSDIAQPAASAEGRAAETLLS